MCRIFGFRSAIQSQVHQSLSEAENALSQQSLNHPDGWGIAYYVDGSPHIVKSVERAEGDHLFRRVSGIASSETVVAHIRKATEGQLSVVNTHPFQFGKWVFAHNGNIQHFQERREKLSELIDPRLRGYILGETDSELLFLILLSAIMQVEANSSEEPSFDGRSIGLQKALNQVLAVIGPLQIGDEAQSDENFLSFVLTDGAHLFAFQGGKELFWSSYKNCCREREHCAYFSESCEAESPDGFVRHLIVSSEPLSGENIWMKMDPGELIGVNSHLKFHKKVILKSNQFSPGAAR